MGGFVSRLLGADMRTLEVMIGELARAVRDGQWEVRRTSTQQQEARLRSDEMSD